LSSPFFAKKQGDGSAASLSGKGVPDSFITEGIPATVTELTEVRKLSGTPGKADERPLAFGYP